MTSEMLVQRSTNWVNRPTGKWIFFKALFSLLLKKSSQLRGSPLHSFLSSFLFIYKWSGLFFSVKGYCGYMINKIIHGCLQIWNFSSRVQLDISLVRCAHSWAIELNTRREIPYLRAPTYHSLSLSLSLSLSFRKSDIEVHEYKWCFNLRWKRIKYTNSTIFFQILGSNVKFCICLI